MWRAVFSAIAITLLLLGLECLVIKKAILHRRAETEVAADWEYVDPLRYVPPSQPAQKSIEPPEWAPWSLLSAGAVVLLYSFSLSSGSRGGDDSNG